MFILNNTFIQARSDRCILGNGIDKSTGPPCFDRRKILKHHD